MSTYLGEFDEWEDVVDAFDLPSDTPEPADVFAAWDEEQYEGYALVIERKPGGLFDVVEGSPNSYWGLEGQFDPTENMPLAAVRKMLEDKSMTSGAYRTEALEWLNE